MQLVATNSNPSRLQVTGIFDTHIFPVLLPPFDDAVERSEARTNAPVGTIPFHVGSVPLIRLTGNQP